MDNHLNTVISFFIPQTFLAQNLYFENNITEIYFAVMGNKALKDLKWYRTNTQGLVFCEEIATG